MLLFLAFWLQIEGLARTSSNRNAFVTGLNVLVVPLIAMALLGRRYGWRLWAACAMALAGMALMFHEDEPWNLGDTLTLASTVFYALYILALEECARRNAALPLRATRMAAAQATVMALASTALLLAQRGNMDWLRSAASLPAESLLALVYLGLLASVVVVSLQAWGQQRVDAMRSAIVFGLEPVFAAVTAWALLGERLGWAGLAGATLIVAGWCSARSHRRSTDAGRGPEQDLANRGLSTPVLPGRRSAGRAGRAVEVGKTGDAPAPGHGSASRRRKIGQISRKR
jgi:drug/metabolite transporter (DMT)-like permease